MIMEPLDGTQKCAHCGEVVTNSDWVATGEAGDGPTTWYHDLCHVAQLRGKSCAKCRALTVERDEAQAKLEALREDVRRRFPHPPYVRLVDGENDRPCIEAEGLPTSPCAAPNWTRSGRHG